MTETHSRSLRLIVSFAKLWKGESLGKDVLFNDDGCGGLATTLNLRRVLSQAILHSSAVRVFSN